MTRRGLEEGCEERPESARWRSSGHERILTFSGKTARANDGYPKFSGGLSKAFSERFVPDWACPA